MGLQRFIAVEPFTFDNGAVGWRPGGPFDCLGPYAKVERCPIRGTDLRRTVYARGYADTHFSVPAHCRIRGRTVKGYLAPAKDQHGLSVEGTIEFTPYEGSH